MSPRRLGRTLEFHTGLLLVLSLVSLLSCQKTESGTPKEQTPTSLSNPTALDNDSIGDAAPSLNGDLIYAQVLDSQFGRALVVGLAGAAPAGITEVVVVNQLSGSQESFLVGSDGSFEGIIDNSVPNDLLHLWGNGPAYGSGEENAITETVQYWYPRFPGGTTAVTYNMAGSERTRGLFAATNDGLYFFRASEVSARADGSYLPDEEVSPAKYTLADGLPSNDILSLAVDGSGGMWVGTAGGLAHLVETNGRIHFEVYRKEGDCPTGCIVDNVIRALAAEDRGVWIATFSGISHLVLRTDGIAEVSNVLQGASGAIVRAPDGSAWFGSVGHVGRISIVGGVASVATLSLPELYRGLQVLSLATATSEDLWIGTERGVLRYRQVAGSPVWEAYSDVEGLPTNYIDSLDFFDGFLWVGTRKGLARLTVKQRDVVVTTFPGSGFGGGRNVTFDGHGTLWTGGHGVSRFSFDTADAGSERAVTTRKYALRDSFDQFVTTRAVALAPEGGVWLGTTSELQRLSWSNGELKVTHLPFAGERSLNRITSLVSDAEGVWVGTDRGLVRVNEKQGLFSFESFSEVPTGVSSLASDSAGGLWIGTSYDLFHLSRASDVPVFTRYALDQASPFAADVVSLLSAGSDRVWIGTGAGLYYLEIGGSQTTIMEVPSSEAPLIDVRILALASDGNGDLWVAPEGLGLARVQFGSSLLTPVPNSEWLAGAAYLGYVQALASRADELWVGGFYSLLHRTPTYAESYFTASWPNIESLAIDESGGVWAAGGLTLRYLSRETFSLRAHPYHSVNTLPSDIESLAVDSRGEIWIGSSGGLTHAKSLTEDRAYFESAVDFGFHGAARCLAPDGSGGYWICSGDGTSHLTFSTDGNPTVEDFSSTQIQQALGPMGVYSRVDSHAASSDLAGGVWLGSMNVGVPLVHLQFVNGLPRFTGYPAVDHVTESVSSLWADTPTTVWVGTVSGLKRLVISSGVPSFRKYTTADGLPGNYIADILPDQTGGFWVTTLPGLPVNSNGGLSHVTVVDGQPRFQNYGTWDGFPTNYIYRIISNGADGFWVGTHQGLSHLTFVEGQARVMNFDADEGIPDLTVVALALNRSGGLLVGTTNGLVLLPASLLTSLGTPGYPTAPPPIPTATPTPTPTPTPAAPPTGGGGGPPMILD